MNITLEVVGAQLQDLYWLDELREYIRRRPEVEQLRINISTTEER